MKKITLSLCLIMAFGVVHADELGDAQNLWEKKDFAGAFQKFSKLAAAGNSSAQLQLGEMYGFGEGTPEDVSQAEYWLKQAAEKGNPDAAQSLVLVRQRALHKPEIAYYSTGFDGGTVAYNRFNCVRPEIPAVSTKNSEIVLVNTAVNTWAECYGRFVINLNAMMPVKKTIPSDILELMNSDEFSRADSLISKTYVKIASSAQSIADEVMADNKKWKEATEIFVTGNNEKIRFQNVQLEEMNRRDARNNLEVQQQRAVPKKKY